MSVAKLARVLDGILSGPEIQYTRWNFNDTKIVVGAPPFPLDGLDFITARYAAPQAKLFKCLTGGGIFASNVNQSGIIEIGIAQWAVGNGSFQIADLTGIPFPVMIEDIASGGTSTVIASACRQTDKPAWTRQAIPGVYTYTFETPRILISHGIHLPFVAI